MYTREFITGDELYHHGILGQKWGVRRYQNEDGTLTEAGKRRYERDQRENAAKKKDNRIDVSKPDPNRWTTEDLSRTKDVVDSTNRTVKDAERVVNDTKPKRSKSYDLSSMTDQELRDAINRNNLELQYTQIMNSKNTSTGRDVVNNVLNKAGDVLAVTGSALSIALAIKQLRG